MDHGWRVQFIMAKKASRREHETDGYIAFIDRKPRWVDVGALLAFFLFLIWYKTSAHEMVQPRCRAFLSPQ